MAHSRVACPEAYQPQTGYHLPPKAEILKQMEREIYHKNDKYTQGKKETY